MEFLTLKQFYIDEFRGLICAERQIEKILPKIVHKIRNRELREKTFFHLEVTRRQITRLESILAELGGNGSRKNCHAIRGLIKECAELLIHNSSSAVLDSAITANLIRIKHFEMAAYSSVRGHSNLFNEDSAQVLIWASLNEEIQFNDFLRSFAESVLDVEAAQIGRKNNILALPRKFTKKAMQQQN